MSLKGKRVFVSGGAGVIGRPLVNKLVNEGALVWVGDLKPRPKCFNESVVYRRGDLSELTQQEVDAFQPEYFFHLAATFERSVETYEFWQENFKHNVCLSNHLMSLLKDCESLKAVVFASSYLIYEPKLYLREEPTGKPYLLKEEDPIWPRNLTGSAKLNHEVELDFLRDFLDKRCRFVSARIFRSYGRGSRDVISRWVRALIKGEEISVFGKEGIFDYVFADDVAEGLARLGMEPKAQGIYNLATGEARSVGEVVSALKEIFPEAKISEGEEVGLYEESEADCSKLEKVIGWKPNKRVEDGIQAIIDYEKRNEEEAHASVGNVLITSISKKVPLIREVRKAVCKLGSDIEIWGGDLNDECIGRYFVDHFWRMPPIDELTTESLIEFCEANQIAFIIPTRDGELEFFAKRKDNLKAAGISVMISSEAAVGWCLDKKKFAKVLNDNGLPSIPVEENVEGFDVQSYVVKEARGAGSLSIGLKLSREEASKHAVSLKEPVFQPYIEGREFSADVYVNKEGDVKGCVLRWRDCVVNGESQVTTTFSNREYEEIVARVAKVLGLTGHAVLQAIVDGTGRVHFIEANCRFGGASALSVSVGLDSFYWFLLESMDGELKGIPFLRGKEKKLVRYADDMIKNLS